MFLLFLLSMMKIIDNSNILSILISMEMITTISYMMMILSMKINLMIGSVFPILFLCMCVCDGAIGLSILVKLMKKNYLLSYQVFSLTKG